MEQQETFVHRIEREFMAFKGLLRRRWLLAITIVVGLFVYMLWQLGIFSPTKPAQDNSAAAAILQVALTYQELFKENQRLNTELKNARDSAQQAEALRLEAERRQIELQLQNVNRDLNRKTEQLAVDPQAYGGVVPQSIKTVGTCSANVGTAGIVTVTCPPLDPSAVETLRIRLAEAKGK
jgi:hypothetical protein